uniref:MTS domain-containing protein n=1 Tax=Syphacia muris TaxID=451379 RepID=A0A158R4D7_9BILA
MVLILPSKASQAAATNCELLLESGKCIHYVAPAHANPCKEVHTESNDIIADNNIAKRKSSYGANDSSDDWEGVNALCHVLDSMVQCETDAFTEGRSVLEACFKCVALIGFATGLPSVFALANGARQATVHCSNKENLECFIKPTFNRNKVNQSRRKFICGDLKNLRNSTKPKQFDVILAPEYINANLTEFEALHDFIDYALAADGICLLTARMFYFNCDGSLPEFLSLVKARGKFDVYIRWSSSKLDVVQRKVVQLTRIIR